MKKLIYLLLFLVIGVTNAQRTGSPMLLVSQQQFDNEGGDSILILNPDVYANFNSIDESATTQSDPVTIWNDLSGNGNNIVPGVAPTLNLDGSDRSVAFSSQWLKITDTSVGDYVLGTDEFTIIIRESGVPVGTGTMFSKAIASTGDRLWTIYKSGAVGNYIIYHGGTQKIFSSGNSASNKLIIVVFTTTTVTFYLDGSQIDTPQTLDTTYASNSAQSVNVGSRTDGGFIYTGRLDLVALIPKAITSGERAAIELEFQIN